MLFQLIINGIIAGSIYALIAIGFTVIYRTVKFFHFAHGVVYTAGAYFADTLLNSLTPQLNNCYPLLFDKTLRPELWFDRI